MTAVSQVSLLDDQSSRTPFRMTIENIGSTVSLTSTCNMEKFVLICIVTEKGFNPYDFGLKETGEEEGYSSTIYQCWLLICLFAFQRKKVNDLDILIIIGGVNICLQKHLGYYRHTLTAACTLVVYLFFQFLDLHFSLCGFIRAREFSYLLFTP